MSAESKEDAPATAELVVTVEASIELPMLDAPPAPAQPSASRTEARAEQVEEAAPEAPPLPTSIKDVIQEAIRNADDDVEMALVEAMRSTQA